jgi:transcription antitermination factor NusA-like protein
MSAKARRILALLRDPRHRTRILDSLNKSTLDDVGTVGGDKGERFLKELNEMADLESKAGQKGRGG